MSSVTIKMISHETGNFFRNQFFAFFIMAISCAFVTIIFKHLLLPNKEQMVIIDNVNYSKNNVELIESIKNLTLEQKKILFRISAAYTISSLIGDALLSGSTLLLIRLISKGYRIGAFKAISLGTCILPKLFILLFLNTILIQIGIMFFIIPGISLAILLALSPIIIVKTKVGIFLAMKNSIDLTLKNVRFVAPTIIGWFLLRILLALFLSNFSNFLLISEVLIDTLNNLISIVLLIYLFRLYMLVYHQ